jgi:hypothetical protein
MKTEKLKSKNYLKVLRECKYLSKFAKSIFHFSFFIFIIIYTFTLCSCYTYPTIGDWWYDYRQTRLGYWIEREAYAIAKKMTDKFSHTKEFDDYIMERDKAPLVLVGTIRNMSTDKIDTELLEDCFNSTIEKTGKANSMQVFDKVIYLPEEVLSYHHTLEEQTALDYLEETPADMFLTGRVVTNVIKINIKAVRQYHVYIELYDARSLKLVWKGSDHSLRKIIHAGPVKREFFKKDYGEMQHVSNKRVR